jgi:hypothetical protein
LIHTYVSVDTIVQWIRISPRGLIKLPPESSEEDYFYRRPNSLLLGFLGAVAIVLLFVMCAFWIGYRIW